MYLCVWVIIIVITYIVEGGEYGQWQSCNRIARTRTIDGSAVEDKAIADGCYIGLWALTLRVLEDRHLAQKEGHA